MAEDDGITQTILNNIADWIANIIRKVGVYLTDLFRPIIDGFNSLMESVFNKLSNIVGAIENAISNMWRTIEDTITSLINDSIAFLKGIYDRVADAIADLFDATVSYLQDTYNTVKDSLLGVVDQVKGFIIDAYDFLVTKAAEVWDAVKTNIEIIFDEIKSGVSHLVNAAKAVVDEIMQAVVTFVDTVVEGIGGSLRDLLETASNIPDAITDLAEGFTESAEKFISDPLGAIPDGLRESVMSAFTEGFGLLALPGVGNKEPVLGTLGAKPRSRAEWDTFFRERLPVDSITSGLFNMIVGIFFTITAFSGVAQAQSQVLLQEYGDENPYMIPQVNELITLKHFNIITDNQAVALIKKWGFDEPTAKHLVSIGETVAPEGEALSWWLRGIIDDTQLDAILSKKGWNEDSKNALREAAFFIPPVQDLITMAVREVFTPAVAERFGQFEDFPEAFAEQAAKTGVSKEWARNYWAAHWALPSVQMGFEMLHRRVIDTDDLNLLLKSADVMPFWRDKLIDISYAPFTRVDIRRMHKVGVLSEEEVFEAYQDIGYDNDKARRLTDFTLELNKAKPVDDDVELVELTRSGLIGFYEDGLLDRAEAYGMLIDIGLSDEAANLYLTSVDLEEQRQERKQDSALILDQAKAGLISFEQAQDAIARLGLETRETAKLLTKLIRQNAQRTKLPSKGDLDKMVLRGIIDETEYKETLHLIGYSNDWADKLFTLLQER